MAGLSGWAAFAQTPSPVPPEILQTYSYYHVTGGTRGEIQSQLERAGPLDFEGRRNDAITSWYVTWTFPLQQDTKGCVTGPVNVTVRLMYQMPRWDRPVTASGEIAKRWGAFISALQMHEDGHKQIVIDGARRIAAALPAIAPQPSCETARLKADIEGQRLLAEIRDRSAGYDRATEHGLTQGARFQ